MTVRAVAHVGSQVNAHGAKIGEEVRFYVGDKVVDTRRIHTPNEYGAFRSGEEYEIELPMTLAASRALATALAAGVGLASDVEQPVDG